MMMSFRGLHKILCSGALILDVIYSIIHMLLVFVFVRYFSLYLSKGVECCYDLQSELVILLLVIGSFYVASESKLLQWTTFLDAEGRVMDPKSLKKRIFYGGVEHNLRKEVCNWKKLLFWYLIFSLTVCRLTCFSSPPSLFKKFF